MKIVENEKIGKVFSDLDLGDVFTSDIYPNHYFLKVPNTLVNDSGISVSAYNLTSNCFTIFNDGAEVQLVDAELNIRK